MESTGCKFSSLSYILLRQVIAVLSSFLSICFAEPRVASSLEDDRTEDVGARCPAYEFNMDWLLCVLCKVPITLHVVHTPG